MFKATLISTVFMAAAFQASADPATSHELSNLPAGVAARVVGLHGMSRDAWKRYDKGGSWSYEVVMPGFKYNLPDVLAAIGLVLLAAAEDASGSREATPAHTSLADVPAVRAGQPKARPKRRVLCLQ